MNSLSDTAAEVGRVGKPVLFAHAVVLFLCPRGQASCPPYSAYWPAPIPVKGFDKPPSVCTTVQFTLVPFPTIGTAATV